MIDPKMLQALRAKADVANNTTENQPWQTLGRERVAYDGKTDGEMIEVCHSYAGRDITDFIAAANPQVVLELLDEHARLIDRIEKAEAAMEYTAKFLEVTQGYMGDVICERWCFSFAEHEMRLRGTWTASCEALADQLGDERPTPAELTTSDNAEEKT